MRVIFNLAYLAMYVPLALIIEKECGDMADYYENKGYVNIIPDEGGIAVMSIIVAKSLLNA